MRVPGPRPVTVRNADPPDSLTADDVRPRGCAAPPRERGIRRPRRRRRDHRRRASRSTPRRAACASALVDKGDFASGTSSKSSKLVHGGIRYLQQKEVGLVYEALAERQIAAQHRAPPRARAAVPAPGVHRGRPAPAASSRASSARRCGRTTSPAALRIGKLHKRVSKDEALAYMPTLPVDRLAASYIYYDAQADDARLTLAVARTAADYGAAVANYAQLVGLDKDARRPRHRRAGPRRRRGVRGARPQRRERDRRLGRRRARARRGQAPRHDPPREGHPHHGAVVAGAQPDRGGGPGAQGSALGVRRAVGRARRRRDAFTYIGTTDTDYDGPLDDPQITPDDIAYLLRAINASVTTTITEADILGTWAGLRPLVARRGERTHRRPVSRRHSVQRSDSGVVTVTGGKLTTYRRMAADAVDEVDGAPRHAAAAAAPRHVKLHGADGLGRARPPDRRSPTATAPTRASVLALAARRHGAGRADRSRPRRTRGPRWCTRCATRWPAPSTTCCRGAPGPGCSPATRRRTRPTTSPR